MKTILRVLSQIYARAMSFRNYLYWRGILASYKSNLPVISIGNISAGGSGKTPLCIFLAKALIEKKYAPVILSRGYGGNYSGVHLVDLQDSAELCGDEPLLMAKLTECPVVLARKRILGAKYIEEKRLGNIILLDDGLQHRGLERDLNIVTINVAGKEDLKDIIEDRVIPFGKLREKRDPALARTDFVVLSSRMPQSKAETPPRDLLKLIPRNIVLVSSYFEPRDVCQCQTEQTLDQNTEVVAFCGIANPEAFFITLESLGFKLKDKITRKDHYYFDSAEIAELKARYKNIPLVCTEKDAARIRNEDLTGIYKLIGTLKVIPEDAFLVQIEKKLKNL